MEPQKPFDQSKIFEIPIHSGGVKVCAVRYPSDQEWIARASKRRTIQHNLGRGKVRAETPNTERIDAELFAKLRQDQDGAEFDDAEAAQVIERLDRIQILESTRDGSTFRISMRVPGAITHHVLKIPLAKDLLEHSRNTTRITYGRRQQEIRINLEAGAELYGKTHESHDGYAGAVPINHKDAAVDELVAQINDLEAEEDAGPEA